VVLRGIKKLMKSIYVMVLALFLASCGSMPDNIKPVSDFELTRYMGKWYEIARLDHRFERGLENVTANYSIVDDGTVKVANRGLSSKSGEWNDAIGKARFANDPSIGHLEVSFFGPFYGPYVIFDLDKDQENYRYAFVASSDKYLWFLSRTPTVSYEIKDKFLNAAQASGYNIEDLIFVNQK
jgi:apolipoprotein D and lipocalin family protein